MAGVIMDINDFSRQIDEIGEEVTELFDGIHAFATAVVSHKEVMDRGELVGDNENGAFGMVKGFPQVLVGLTVIVFNIEMICAYEDQVGETTFFDEQVFIPFAVVIMERKRYVVFFAL